MSIHKYFVLDGLCNQAIETEGMANVIMVQGKLIDFQFNRALEAPVSSLRLSDKKGVLTWQSKNHCGTSGIALKPFQASGPSICLRLRG
jgi:hypothetical protein